MKELKVAKFHVYETMKSIKGFYTILISFMAFFTLLTITNKGNVSSSGIDVATMIFLFVIGLNSYRSNFKFTQANSVSRKTFFKGILIGSLPIAVAMSIIDLILNRVYNIFVDSPTMYDMIYGMYYSVNWVQSTGFTTLVATFVWQFALYTLVFWVGVLVSLIYYRSNTLMKVIVSIMPIVFLSFLGSIFRIVPISFIEGFARFLELAFGLRTLNSYPAALSFLVMASVLAGFAFLLNRRAIVKE